MNKIGLFLGLLSVTHISCDNITISTFTLNSGLNNVDITFKYKDIYTLTAETSQDNTCSICYQENGLPYMCKKVDREFDFCDYLHMMLRKEKTFTLEGINQNNDETEWKLLNKGNFKLNNSTIQIPQNINYCFVNSNQDDLRNFFKQDK